MFPKPKNYSWILFVILFILELIRRSLSKEDIFEELGKRFSMSHEEASDFWKKYF